jgi:putative DNA primase/helicase
MPILHCATAEHQRQARQAATAYATLGWRVVSLHGVLERNGQPICTCSAGENCTSPGKHPRLTNWHNLATIDEEAIAELWKRWPISNIGVRLGPVSGIMDCEYDCEQGRQTAERLLSPCYTPTYTSARSTHRLFQFPAGLAIPKAVVHTNGLELRFGVEARGSQSVFPPSVHVAGVAYRWLEGLSPGEVQPLPFPDALAELLACETGGNGKGNGDGFTCEGHFWETPGAKEGERYDSLGRLAGRYLATYGVGDWDNLLSHALAWNAKCHPPEAEAAVTQRVRWLWEKESAKRRATPKVEAVQPTVPQVALLELVTQCFADIEAEPVHWLWFERIALGKLSLICGEPGLGKTFVSCDMAARVSRGLDFPDGSPCEVGEVALLTAEDGAGDTLRPRLDAAGADVSKVHIIEGIRAPGGREVFLNLGEHIGLIEAWLVQRPTAKLLIIDPITAFLGRTDSHENAAVRGVLGPVAKLAERRGISVTGITHLNKRETKALHRITGSIAFVAAARAAWLVATDPDDEGGDRRLFLPVKNNLGRASGLAFAITDGRVAWEPGPVLTSADDIDGEGDASPREEAMGWLTDLLTAGPIAATKVWAKAKMERIAERTLKRAKKELGIVSERVGDAWAWRLPDGQDSQTAEGTYRF